MAWRAVLVVEAQVVVDPALHGVPDQQPILSVGVVGDCDLQLAVAATLSQPPISE